MSAWVSHQVDVRLRGSSIAVRFAERAARGAPLIYLHGLGSSRRDFEAAARAPELSGRRLIGIDLPGSGESRVPADLELTIEDLVTAVESIRDALACPRFHLVGHSMGGLVALWVAWRSPRRVATLVNVEGNLAPVDCRVFSRRVRELAARLEPEVVVQRLASELAESGRLGYATFAERFRFEVQPEAFTRLCRSIVEVTERDPLLDMFRDLPMPRLFVYGDQNGDLAYLEDLRSGGVRVEEIPNSDHFPIYTHPRRFFAVLGDFVDRHEAGETTRIERAEPESD